MVQGKKVRSLDGSLGFRLAVKKRPGTTAPGAVSARAGVGHGGARSPQTYIPIASGTYLELN